MDLNVRGYFLLSQQVAKSSMIPHGGGRIINVSSIAGLSSNPPIQSSPTTPPRRRCSSSSNLAAHRAADFKFNAICPGFFVTKLATAAIAMAGG